MKLISWNINGRRRQAAAQIAAILSRSPDVVLVQEVTASSLAPIRDTFAKAGLTEVVDSFHLAPAEFRPKGPRKYGQLTASRHPITPEAPGRFDIPWPERVLSVNLTVEGQDIEVHNVHVPPGSSNGWIKIDVLNGIFMALARPSLIPRILAGDFNAPQMELTTGEIITWAQRPGSAQGWRIVKSRHRRPGLEWDAGERNVISGLSEFDLFDVYRLLHGYGPSEESWVLKRKNGNVGRRFDHVFASKTLLPVGCEYLHELRTSGLSDHSPIEAIFGLVSSTTLA